MKGEEAVEGWGWPRKFQVFGKFLLQPSPVAKMVWSNEQRAFPVETYFSQSHSNVAVQRALRTRYQIPPQDRVPDRKSILLWVENFRGTGSVSKKEDDRRPLGHQRTSRLSHGPFCSLPGALHANKHLPLASQIVLFVEFFTKTATAHTARKSVAVLREMFPGRLISLSGDISLPARSPDLTT